MLAVMCCLSYFVLVFSMFVWLVKHPLSVGGLILFLYMMGSVSVGVMVSFVLGLFLFLTGVSGMMVAFLYVVALCPNPVFKGGWVSSSGYGSLLARFFIVSLVTPLSVLFVSVMGSFKLEAGLLMESFQWLRDPVMGYGLMSLMPFLGVLLFLCMVSVVLLCNQQKQCLGGHSSFEVKRSYY